MRLPVTAAVATAVAMGGAALVAVYRRSRAEGELGAELGGEVVTATGVSGGLGLLTATELAMRSCRLLLSTRDLYELDRAAARLREPGAQGCHGWLRYDRGADRGRTGRDEARIGGTLSVPHRES